MGELVTLNCIYFTLFGLGVGYALITLVLGGISDIDIPGIDIDIPGIDLHPGEADFHLELPFAEDLGHDLDHPDIGISPLSPITIATFVTTFGGVGIIVNTLTTLSPVVGLVIAALSGLVLAGMMFVIYAQVIGAVQGSSETRAGELRGRTAEVTAPIPPAGVGEVALVIRGARARALARSDTGTLIPRGTLVEIVEEAGSAVIVRPRQTQVEE